MLHEKYSVIFVSENHMELIMELRFRSQHTPLSLFQQVTQGNRMDARNLATIFAPSILRPDHAKLHASLAENEQQIAIVETMIAHVEDVFRVIIIL